MDFFEPGVILDDFELGPALRDGAMARVYRAVDRLTGEAVALKVPFKDILNNPLLYYHHQTEDRILRRLDHPHIIRSIRRRRTSLYLVLEWIDGPDLKSLLLRQGKIPLDQVLSWADQILEALVYLHAQGVHHLDLKPENIMRASGGQLKLVDFGLAWLRGARDLLAEDFNNPHGTPDYAAPEQIRGVRHDPRSDLYSLGLVLYELISGAFPFKRSRYLSEVRKRSRIEPVPLSHHEPDVPGWLDRFILTAITPDPERRHPSAQVMVDALRAGVAGVDSACQRAAPSAESARPRRGDDPGSGGARPQLLGAITDNAAADAVIDVLRREALKIDGEITLLTVNSEVDDSDLVRYATAVEGAQLGRRLEGYVKALRDHGLDPLVRIRQGVPMEEIMIMAEAISADLVVVGATRRQGFKKLFGGRLVDKFIRKAPCRVIVADQPFIHPPPDDLDPSDLRNEDLLDIEFFLHDNWVHHLNHLADVSRPYPVPDGEFPADPDCALQTWLQACRRQTEWQPLVRALTACHQRLHAEMDLLAEAAKDADWDRMRQCYLTTALPRMCEFRQALREFSQALKTRTAARQVAALPLVREENCPLGGEGASPDGPLASLASIRDYFCRHPEASPEACLVHLRGRTIHSTVTPGEE